MALQLHPLTFLPPSILKQFSYAFLKFEKLPLLYFSDYTFSFFLFFCMSHVDKRSCQVHICIYLQLSKNYKTNTKISIIQHYI